MGTEGGTKTEDGRGKERRVKDYVLTSSVHSQLRTVGRVQGQDIATCSRKQRGSS